jgi:hypothetical protein
VGWERGWYTVHTVVVVWHGMVMPKPPPGLRSIQLHLGGGGGVVVESTNIMYEPLKKRQKFNYRLDDVRSNVLFPYCLIIKVGY